MKNDLIWTKTLLSVYRYLERICGAIDKIVMRSALGSSDIVGQSYFYNNVHAITQKIINLSERKVTLINLKILIEDSLKNIPEKDAQLLIERYVDGKKFTQIAEDNALSMRTVFRRLSNAENSFKKNLNLKGYTDLRIKYMLKDEVWINNIYLQFSNKKQEDFILSNAYLAKAVSM